MRPETADVERDAGTFGSPIALFFGGREHFPAAAALVEGYFLLLYDRRGRWSAA
jgi:hypothetical protein